MVAKKELWKKYIYYFCYLILASILIKSDTFGAYLGVIFSIMFMLLHAFLIKKNIIPLAIVLASFVLLSVVIRNNEGKMYIEYNFNTTYHDLIKVKNHITSTNTKSDTQPQEISLKYNDSTAIKLTKAKYEGIWYAGAGRMKIWFTALELVKQKPFFGFGLESLYNEYYGQFGISEGRSHNLILQLSATTGIPGMLFYIVAITIILIRNLKDYKNWNDMEYISMFVCISYMISSMFGNSSYYVSPYFMMFIGFIIIKPRQNMLKNNIENPKKI
jgi:O-antigen ligase